VTSKGKISPQQNGHKAPTKLFDQSEDTDFCPRNTSSSAKLVSPAYSCRNGQVSDARVRNIKSSQRQTVPSESGINQLKPKDEPDYSRLRHANPSSNDEADFSRLLHFNSTKRVTPSPLKRLSGLVI
jgi:hypothetical protein